MQSDAVVMDAASVQGSNLLLFTTGLKAGGAKGASIDRDLTQRAQEPAATGAVHYRFLPRMVKTLGLALGLNMFSVLPFSHRTVKGIEEIDPGKSVALGTRMELSGIGDIGR